MSVSRGGGSTVLSTADGGAKDHRVGVQVPEDDRSQAKIADPLIQLGETLKKNGANSRTK